MVTVITTANLALMETRRPGRVFPDGYDLDAEKQRLGDLLDLKPHELMLSSDPRKALVLEYHERLAEWEESERATASRLYAEPIATREEARGIYNNAGLLPEEDPVLSLHTRDANRLFVGQVAAAGRRVPIVGAKRCAAAMRALFLLSGRNNPYADLALISFDQEAAQVTDYLRKETAKVKQVLDAEAERGLRLRVVRAESPQEVRLTFRSPYGFTIARLLLDLDYYIRVLVTAKRADLMSEDEWYVAKRAANHKLRSLIVRIVQVERFLSSDELALLNRHDWIVANSDENARRRVEIVVASLGEVPRDIFAGKVRPRQRPRREEVSAKELKLLQEVPLTLPEVEREAAISAEGGQL